MNERVELLAPAGSIEALKAAVENGADAVYLGGKQFNARQFASNFTNEEILEAISYAHFWGVKIYVTLNILLDNSELKEALNYAKWLASIGVDAIIVQDIGFAYLVKQYIPNLPIHASTQMSVHNLEGVKHLESMGFDRVVLAREVPLKDIEHIKQNSNIELEVFVHGALCICYSGQCLMSSLIGSRSGNRGACAQPCRLPYSIFDVNDNRKISQASYFLSTKDLYAQEHINELMSVGVKSFKVEGRMKKPEYVATVVKAYKNTILKSTINEKDKENLAQIFNRGFTKGHTFGDFGEEYLSLDRPDNRGIEVGEVTQTKGDKAFVVFNRRISIGDGLEWNNNKGELTGFRAVNSYEKGIELEIKELEGIAKGTKLRRTYDTKLMERALAYQKEWKNKPIELRLEIKKANKPKLTLLGEGIEVEVFGEDLVQVAKRLPITEETVLKQLQKLGNTSLELASVSLDIDEGIFMPLSAINELRRKATHEFEQLLVQKNTRKTSQQAVDIEELLSFKKETNTDKRISVSINNIQQLEGIDIRRVQRVLVDYNENTIEVLRHLEGCGCEVFLSTPRIMFKDDIQDINAFVKKHELLLDGIVIANIGTLELFKNTKLKLIGDLGLNVFNSASVDYLRKCGLETIQLSPELNLIQISRISKEMGGDLEVIVYGNLPSMITKNCPTAALKGCKNDKACKGCKYQQGYGLLDRQNKVFPIKRENGFTTIYNPMPVFVPELLYRLNREGINTYRLNFTIEKNTNEITEIYDKAISSFMDKEFVKDLAFKYKLKFETTNGHFNRGII